jgi:hypothetical protein
VSIVRIGLAETKNFAAGYEAIFGNKKPAKAVEPAKAVKPARVAKPKSAKAKKKKPAKAKKR